MYTFDKLKVKVETFFSWVFHIFLLIIWYSLFIQPGSHFSCCSVFFWLAIAVCVTRCLLLSNWLFSLTGKFIFHFCLVGLVELKPIGRTLHLDEPEPALNVSLAPAFKLVVYRFCAWWRKIKFFDLAHFLFLLWHWDLFSFICYHMCFRTFYL